LDRCYLPCLDGNPVFFVADDRVLSYGINLLHFSICGERAIDFHYPPNHKFMIGRDRFSAAGRFGSWYIKNF
jgi:hypothetical protein